MMRRIVAERWKEAGGSPRTEKSRKKVVYLSTEEKADLMDELATDERFENAGTGDLLVPTSVVFGMLSYIIVRVKKVELAD